MSFRPVSPNELMSTRRAGLLVAALLFLCASPTMAAPPDASTVPLQVEHFEPLPNQTTNIWNVLTSDTMGHLGWSTGAVFHYSKGLFKAHPASGDDIQLVEQVLKAEPFLAFALLGVAEIGVVVPVALYQTGEDLAVLNRAGQQVDGVGLGDIRFALKAKLIDPAETDGIGLGFAVPISVPSGDEVSYNSESGVRLQPTLSLDYRHDIGLRVAANIGYYLRDDRQLLNLTIGPELRWALGVDAPTGVDGLSLSGALFGAVGDDELVDPVDPARPADEPLNNPIELLLGARYDGAYGVHTSLAGGFGLNSNVGAPDFRVLLAIGYGQMRFDDDHDGVANEDDHCPDIKEDLDGFEDADGCPEADNDQDGIADQDDACPDQPEDTDSFEDGDGCPDPDNDKDGVVDGSDNCPNLAEDLDQVADEDGCPEDDDNDGIADEVDACRDVPEDLDGYEDADGCPDLDNDDDGIPDADDRCMNDAEDVDGYNDGDGCPDVDNDGDGFLDGEDTCPNEAEVINGVKDDDGCPDEGLSKVVITETQIQILEKVFFDTNKATIKPVSFGVLDQVATVLRNNKRITLIRVEGHTDNTGDAAKNKALSQARAESVRTYLIDKGGIEPARLEAVGYGQDKPIADNATKEGKETNRRVEFAIIE